MNKKITYTIDLQDALMLMSCIQGYLTEMEERGDVQTPGDLLVLNPVKRVYQDMIKATGEQATGREIHAASREADRLYFNEP